MFHVPTAPLSPFQHRLHLGLGHPGTPLAAAVSGGPSAPALNAPGVSHQFFRSLQCEAPKIAKLVQITPITIGLWYILITIVL